MNTIKGAEAEVEIREEKVVKTRNRKKYRHRELDSKLRKERTGTEQELIERADRYGVNVPGSEKVDENTLEIERIEGKQLKEVIGGEEALLEKLGENIGNLHSADIIHGDLTTSNIITGEGEPYLIDFGLSFRSQRVEDRAVDIHLFRQVLESSHPEVSEEAWESFIEGYSAYEKSGQVLEQLEEVESRGRYK